MNYTVVELIMISVLGFLLVFLVLLSLALLTVFFGKLILTMENKKTHSKVAVYSETRERVQENEQEDEMEEVLAVLQCVLSEESGIAGDDLVIQSVRRDET